MSLLSALSCPPINTNRPVVCSNRPTVRTNEANLSARERRVAPFAHISSSVLSSSVPACIWQRGDRCILSWESASNKFSVTLDFLEVRARFAVLFCRCHRDVREFIKCCTSCFGGMCGRLGDCGVFLFAELILIMRTMLAVNATSAALNQDECCFAEVVVCLSSPV